MEDRFGHEVGKRALTIGGGHGTVVSAQGLETGLGF